MKNKIIVFFSISLLLFACKTAEQNINVLNVDRVQGIRNYSTMYALPKNVIRVDIEICQTIKKPGPFAAYAKSLLHIDNAIQHEDIKWNIKEVKFSTYPIPDSSNMYIIEHDDYLNNLGISLSRSGLICAVNTDVDNRQVCYVDEQNKLNAAALNYNPDEKALNSLEMINFNDVPLLKDVNAKKSIAAQAQMLAEKIYTLRDDRAAILVGDGYSEALPDGVAMKEIVRELNKLEQKYLSMFTGKEVKRCYHYSFDFSPEIPKKITQAILFRFSKAHGVVAMDDVSGTPVIIEVESQQNIQKIINLNKRQKFLQRTTRSSSSNVRANGLYYRIPEMVSVKLMANERVLAQKSLMLAQFGDTHPLNPVYMNGKYSIEYYPELGSIKHIKKLTK